MRNPPPYLLRRRFLAGAGTLLALPLLESLLPRSARAATTPAAARRLLVVHTACGREMGPFTPSTVGANFALPTTLASLSKVQKSVLVLTGMQHDAAAQSLALSKNSNTGKHALGMGTLFTGAKLIGSSNNKPSTSTAAVSMDQIYAKTLAGQTPVASLQLALNKVADQYDGDNGFTGQTMRSISYADPGSPLDEQQDPQAVFNNYFAGASDSTASAALTAQRSMRKSVLDNVLGQATTLQGKLSRADASKLDQYFTSVRALETQFSATTNASCAGGKNPGPITASDFQGQANAMMDLMVLAFQCDLTRVMSFNFGVGHSSNKYDFLDGGLADTVHALSHSNEKSGDQRAKYVQQKADVEAWEISVLARFWEGLAAVNDGSGTLLDNSVSLVASEIADSNNHDYGDTGYLVVGGGGGTITGGRHVVAGANGNLTALQLAILQGLGTGVQSFGGFDTTQPLVLTA